MNQTEKLWGIAMLIPETCVAYGHTLETTVYLSSRLWGKGMGTQLMMRLIEECRREGYHALIVCLTELNEDSTFFYILNWDFKYLYLGEVELKFGRWLDVSDYELIL